MVMTVRMYVFLYVCVYMCDNNALLCLCVCVCVCVCVCLVCVCVCVCVSVIQEHGVALPAPLGALSRLRRACPNHPG